MNLIPQILMIDLKNKLGLEMDAFANYVTFPKMAESIMFIMLTIIKKTLSQATLLHCVFLAMLKQVITEYIGRTILPNY